MFRLPLIFDSDLSQHQSISSTQTNLSNQADHRVHSELQLADQCEFSVEGPPF